MTLSIIAIYMVLVLGIGALSHRVFRGTGEDYFLATRSIGPFVLLMSLFGTQMTSYALLGASGQSYRAGIGVFGLMASSSAIVVPAVFFFIGTRAWAVGKRGGYTTQVQLFRARWASDMTQARYLRLWRRSPLIRSVHADHTHTVVRSSRPKAAWLLCLPVARHRSRWAYRSTPRRTRWRSPSRPLHNCRQRKPLGS